MRRLGAIILPLLLAAASAPVVPPAETADAGSAGGESIHPAPQHSMPAPRARMPQVWAVPAATAPNSPAGGLLMP